VWCVCLREARQWMRDVFNVWIMSRCGIVSMPWGRVKNVRCYSEANEELESRKARSMVTRLCRTRGLGLSTLVLIWFAVGV